MHPAYFVGLAAVARLAWAAPLAAQSAEPDWQMEGLRTGFCVQLLLDPASEALENLPKGFRPVPASEVKDLPPSLRGIVDGQPEFASWSPSRLCVHVVESIRAGALVVGDHSGSRFKLFASWTVEAAALNGGAREVALGLFTSDHRLVRPARLVGQVVREAKLSVGKVPEEDENGVPSTDDRLQVRLGKTVITWDGRLAGDSVPVSEPVAIAWAAAGSRDETLNGQLTLTPSYSRAMVGALKVDGKDALAKALRASPTRFAGPAYLGGAGSVTFKQ
jgi:hypothetical protein